MMSDCNLLSPRSQAAVLDHTAYPDFREGFQAGWDARNMIVDSGAGLVRSTPASPSLAPCAEQHEKGQLLHNLTAAFARKLAFEDDPGLEPVYMKHDRVKVVWCYTGAVCDATITCVHRSRPTTISLVWDDTGHVSKGIGVHWVTNTPASGANGKGDTFLPGART